MHLSTKLKDIHLSVFSEMSETCDMHPTQLFKQMIEWCEYGSGCNSKDVFWTNNEHEINACRIAMKRGYLKSFVVWHCDGKHCYELKCGEDGEFDEYPSGFLDQWTNELSELL